MRLDDTDLPEELSGQGVDQLVRAVAVAAKPYFDEGSDHVVVARHCGTLYVGTLVPKRCGSCGEADPEALRIVYARPDEEGPHGILMFREDPS